MPIWQLAQNDTEKRRPVEPRILSPLAGSGGCCVFVKLYVKQSKQLSTSHEGHPSQAERDRKTQEKAPAAFAGVLFIFLFPGSATLHLQKGSAFLHYTHDTCGKTKTTNGRSQLVSFSTALSCTHTDFLHTLLVQELYDWIWRIVSPLESRKMATGQK